MLMEKQLKYLVEEVLEKFSWVIKLISMLDDLKFFTESDKKIIEPIQEASNKKFALPQERYFLQKDIQRSH